MRLLNAVEVLMRAMSFPFLSDSDYFFEDLWSEISTALQRFAVNKVRWNSSILRKKKKRQLSLLSIPKSKDHLSKAF